MSIVPNGVPANVQLYILEKQKREAAEKIISNAGKLSEKRTAATAYIENEGRSYKWHHGTLKKNIDAVMRLFGSEFLTAKQERIHKLRLDYAGKAHRIDPIPKDIQDRSREIIKRWRRKRNDGPLKGDCVYLVQGLPSVFKIGKASNVTARLSSLQTGSPVPLKLVACIPTNNVRWVDEELEALLHWEFADYRLHGEWFHMDKEVLTHFFKHSADWVVKYHKPEILETED